MSYCLIPKDRMYSFAGYIKSIQNINTLLNTNNMITNLNEASAEIDTQTGLLSEIVTMLQSSESGNKTLPEGYTLLKYIESSGTQYINTGFNPNQNTKMLMDIEIPAQSSYPVALCGGRGGDTSSSASFVIFLMASGQFRTDFGTNNITTAEYTFPDRFTINKNRNATFLNNAGYLNTETTFQSNYPIGLFTEIDVGGADTRMATIKMYYCKIYDNDILVRDFVPCINAEGEYGLYDFVNSQFYGNAGTGSFTGVNNDSNLISFIIGNASYQAEKNMTWTEWYESEYNPGDLISCSSSGDYIYDNEASGVLYLNNSPVIDTDIIIDGSIYIWGSDPSMVEIISFTINGTSYQAEEGMTWTEWCDSEYNIEVELMGKKVIYQDTVYTNESHMAYITNVSSTDIIISGHAYYTTTTVSGGN